MLMHMSISGGILIILILALRMLAIKRLPKKVFVLLWEIAALRLLIPFDLPLRYGIVSPVVVHAEKAVLDVSRPAAGIIDWRMVLWILWISGIAILLFIFGIRYYRESQRLADALPVSKDEDEILRMLVKIPERVKIYVSDRTSTPLTVGMVQSWIILPKQLRADRIDLKYVLAHEMVHIRRADNVLKMIMLMAACIHWFNPLAWMMYLFFDRDIELSCDERVLEIYGEKQKKKYAETLLDLAGTAMTVFAGGSTAAPGKSSEVSVGMVEIGEKGTTGTRHFQSKDGLTDVEVTVQNDNTYHAEADYGDNDELDISIYPEEEQ